LTITFRVYAPSLPNLRDDVQKQLANLRKNLSSLPPPPPKEPVSEIYRLMSSFSREVGLAVMGAEGHENLMQQCRRVFLQLQKDIWSTRPNFSPLPKGAMVKPSNSPNGLGVDGDGLKVPPTGPIMDIDEVHTFIEG